MKYSLIFAATAAAYDSYGGYGEGVKSSAAVKPSSSAKPIGYTTIYPGYNKQPVTVTTQHQPYPTCVSAGYDGKSCGKWEDDAYVSTTIKDCDKKVVTVTKIKQPVTVYHTKKTITHSATGYPTTSAGYAQPTGSAYKNGTEGCWYELYEKIEEVPYNKLGPHALHGYPGSGLYPEGDKKQYVHVKEYKGGKWSEYDHEYSYGKPEEEVTTYAKPGIYTVPAKDVTVDYAVTHPAEATKTAKAGETCTYGGQYIDAKETGYVTGAYGAYETKVYGDKTETETVIKYTTLYVSSTGKVEVCKPTTTVYDHDTEVAYPTAKSYAPGVYHHDAQTVTVTKGGEAYTCKYEQTKTYAATAKGDKGYPAYPTSTSVKDNSYGYKPSATPKKPTEDDKYPTYPSYPAKGNSSYSHVPESYPSSTPVAVYSQAYDNNGYGGYAKPTPAAVSSKPYDANAYGYPAPTPVYDDKHYNGSPAKSSSTPCPSDKAPTPTHVKPSVYEPAPYGPAPTSVKPSAYEPVAYAPAPSPVKPSVYSPEAYSHPTPSPVAPASYGQGYGNPVQSAAKPKPSGDYKEPSSGYGTYAKRDGMAERRKRSVLL